MITGLLVLVLGGPAGGAPGTAASNGVPASAPAELAEDLAVYRRDFLDRDRAFSPAARSEAAARLAALAQSTGPVDPVDVAVELSRIAALADNGHTECFTWAMAEHFARVPLEIIRFGDGYWVIGGDAKHEDLFGLRLDAVDGHPIDGVRDALRPLIGGVPAFRDDALVPFLRSPPVLHAVGVARAPDGAGYRFVAPGRGVVERLLATDAGPMSDWRWLVPRERTPWTFLEQGELLRRRDAPELDAMMIQLRRIENTPRQSIADFLEGAERDRRALGRRNFVIDLRASTGGDLTTARDFMARLPGRVGRGGRIFVLTGSTTFSAAIATTAYLRQAGGRRVVLVGEPPGDRLVFFAEGRAVVLPHSKLVVLPATARHDYRNGCRTYDDCFVGVAQPGRPTGSPPALVAVVGRRPITVSSLDPDVAAPWTMEAFKAGRDPALDAVAALVAAAKRRRR